MENRSLTKDKIIELCKDIPLENIKALMDEDTFTQLKNLLFVEESQQVLEDDDYTKRNNELMRFYNYQHVSSIP